MPSWTGVVAGPGAAARFRCSFEFGLVHEMMGWPVQVQHQGIQGLSTRRLRP
jgi:hypothetical protein